MSLGSISFVVILILHLVLARPTEHSFTRPLRKYQSRQCQPFFTSFKDPSTVSPENTLYPNSPFIALSPTNTYQFTPDGGLQLSLLPPTGPVHKFPENGTSDNLGQAGIVNSTFWIDLGRVTFEFKTSLVPGAVAALILIDANKASDNQFHLDEIDIECVGKNQHSWQSNIFKPSKADPSPHYGVFSQTHRLTGTDSSIAEFHKISIEKREETIIWSVDGDVVRTLNKDDTYINGISHFPSDDVRLQFGIWDGSGAKGTSSWSGGPIDWSAVHSPLTMTLRSVSVEC